MVIKKTRSKGIFAAGDTQWSSPRQVAAAVRGGFIAATSAFKYIQEQGNERGTKGH
jgi:thioredoxin reductase